MGAKFSVETRRGDSYRLNPADIEFSEFTGRRFGATDEAIDKMVESLLANGQLQDIGIRKGFDDKPICVFGHTRVLAAQRINERKLTSEPFQIRATYFNINDSEACIYTLLENDGDTRTAVSPIDTAFMIRQLETRFGWNQSEIAEKLGKNQAEISKYRKLLELDSKTQKEIASGNINLHMALTLVNIKPDERPAVLELAKEEAKTNGKKLTSRELVNVARNAGATTKTTMKRSVGELRKVLIAERDRPKSKRAAFLITSSILDFLDGKENDLIDVIRGL